MELSGLVKRKFGKKKSKISILDNGGIKRGADCSVSFFFTLAHNKIALKWMFWCFRSPTTLAFIMSVKKLAIQRRN